MMYTSEESQTTCDKCGESVQSNEDVTWLEAIAKKNNSVLLNHARHILCSPSRAQYIVHDDYEKSHDYREDYDKRLKPKETVERLEKLWTDAWVELQVEANWVSEGGPF
jgi:hypothetical protein